MTMTPDFAADLGDRAYGTVPAHLTPARIRAARDAAMAANDGLPLTPVPVFTGRVWADQDPHGPINAKTGSAVRMARWIVAYMATCIVYGLPLGVRYVPCYLSGDIFDAWLLDAEHVGSRTKRGTYAGGLLLAQSAENRFKGEGGRVAAASEKMVEDMTRHLIWPACSPRPGNAAREFFHAHPRRK